MFVRLGSVALVMVLLVIVGGAAFCGALVGRRLRERHGTHRESVGVIQGTLLGFLGRLIAFGLTMAVGRYDARRATVVQEANDIGTTFLRAQLLAPPTRSEAIDLLREYADVAVSFADRVPGFPPRLSSTCVSRSNCPQRRADPLP